MVSVLQRAFACFSCQGVNSRQASKTKESRAKADSRLNLWQPQTKIFLVKMVQRFNLKVHIIQWMSPSHHRELWFNRLLISCFVVAFKSDLWIIGVYCELWSVNKPSRYKPLSPWKLHQLWIFAMLVFNFKSRTSSKCLPQSGLLILKAVDLSSCLPVFGRPSIWSHL